MSVGNFKELRQHIGHKIECVCYGKKGKTLENVAIECETCNEVLLSFDKWGETMAKECLWYNGEIGCYELLDFDPNGLTKRQLQKKALHFLKKKYHFNKRDLEIAAKTIYLVDIDDLKDIFKR